MKDKYVKSNIAIACGSHGSFAFDAETGGVIAQLSKCECEECQQNGQYADTIIRVNVKEWEEAHPDEKITEVDSIDILDLAHWEKGKPYHTPDYDWRKHTAKFKKFAQKVAESGECIISAEQAGD